MDRYLLSYSRYIRLPSFLFDLHFFTLFEPDVKDGAAVDPLTMIFWGMNITRVADGFRSMSLFVAPDGFSQIHVVLFVSTFTSLLFPLIYVSPNIFLGFIPNF